MTFIPEEERERVKHIGNPARLIADARRFIQSNQLSLADLYLNRALEVSPNNIEAIDLDGFVKYFLGDYKSCKEMNERALKLDPDHTYAYKGLGLALAKMGQVEEGIQSLRKAIELTDINFMDPYYDLAVVFYEHNRFDEALQVLEEGRAKSRDFTIKSDDFYQMLIKRKAS